MKLELSIKTDYLPSWGIWQGLRELVQNARDASFELKAPLTVDWYNDTVRIANEGCTLPHESLLFGHTTKIGKADMIGRFGEGMKLGILALVRAGFPVKIRSGSELWVPAIAKSEKFNAEVLVFDVQGGRKPENRVRVEVQGINKATWESARWKFRFLPPVATPDSVVESEAGALILDSKLKGHVFVKGIYVHSDPKLDFGYDIKHAELDRDRKLVDPYDFMVRSKDILAAAVAQRPDLLGAFISVLEKQTPESKGFDSNHTYAPVPKQLSQAVAADFKAKHGPLAVPVKTLGDSKDLDHLGKKGVIVSDALLSVLSSEMPSAASVKESLQQETTKKYGWHELNEGEQQSLTSAVGLIAYAEGKVTLDDIDVVDFQSPDLRGLFKDGRFQIARSRVGDDDDCLATLIHEVAHTEGLDGAKDHVAAIEGLWAGVVRYLRASARAPKGDL